MIKRTETIEIELTPREIAKVIVDMADDEQADVLRELAEYHTFRYADFVMQLESIKGIIEEYLSIEEKAGIKRMFDSFVEYIEAIDWEDDAELKSESKKGD